MPTLVAVDDKTPASIDRPLPILTPPSVLELAVGSV
jgi:hypothetical protein